MKKVILQKEVIDIKKQNLIDILKNEINSNKYMLTFLTFMIGLFYLGLKEEKGIFRYIPIVLFVLY